MAPAPVARQLHWPAVLDDQQRWLHICTQLIDMNVARQRECRYAPSIARYGDDIPADSGCIHRQVYIPLE